MLIREETSVKTHKFHYHRERSGTIEVRNMLSIMFLICQFLFDFYLLMLRYVKMTCVDIGPSHLAGESPSERQVAVRYMVVFLSKAYEEPKILRITCNA